MPSSLINQSGNTIKYDVLLGYSAKDKDIMRALATRLRADGLTVWFDEWEIQLTDTKETRALKRDIGVERSRTLIVSADADHTVRDILKHHGEISSRSRIIPVIFDETEIEQRFMGCVCIDWRQQSEKEYERLFKACRHERSNQSYDVFLGLSINDQEVMLGMATRLQSDGLRVWFDEWEIQPGDNIIERVEDGLEISRILLVSPDSYGIIKEIFKESSTLTSSRRKKYGNMLDAKKSQRRMIPLIIDDNKITLELSRYVCIDWRQQSDKEYERLFKACTHEKSIENYDVFLGYSLNDQEIMRRLATQLHSDGLRVWFDEWEIQPGDIITERVEDGLERSRTLIIGMSSNASDADWTILERYTERFRDPNTFDRRFIPLRLDDSSIKDTLRQFAYIDWRQKSDDQYLRLLSVCQTLRVESKPSPESQTQSITNSERHWGHVWGVAVTHDGSICASGSVDRDIKIWDTDKGKCVKTLKGHQDMVRGVAFGNDNRRLVSSSYDGSIKIWDIKTGECLETYEGLCKSPRSLAITDKYLLTSTGGETIRGGKVDVWDLNSGSLVRSLIGHSEEVLGIAVTKDGERVITGSADTYVKIWNINSGECVTTLQGHTGMVMGVAITASGDLAVSGSSDSTIRVWDLVSGKKNAILEGHTSQVASVAITPNGKRLVSGSFDKRVKVWDILSGFCLATFEHDALVNSVALTWDGLKAISGSDDWTVGVWNLQEYVQEENQTSETTRYTNAKVLIVGETGVGKTSLAIRLIEDRFEPTQSSDSAWATQMKLPQDADSSEIEREIWLWDFAGQADYRLINQLFMDETALELLVFNPQSENPFEGLGQWDRDLQRAARRSFNKLLVAGRCERGGLMVSRESINRFIAERGFTDYIETSAFTGFGCPELKEMVTKHIPWESIPWTASPRIFKLLKEEIVKLKDEGKVLFRIAELKQQLEIRMPGESFTLEELRAVIRLLISPGVVWQLEFGDFVLLHPERINAYAAAVIRTVRKHTDEIGSVFEEDVLAGNLDYQGMPRLLPDEEQIVLRAMYQTFVDHGLCLREHTEKGVLLVFPSYFKRERPELVMHPMAFVTYSFNGMLDEIYATLVVRLHHTAAFERDQLWKFAADFLTMAGKRLGVKVTKKPEGSAELTVYFDSGIADETKVTFIRYVHDHLKAKDPDMVRVRHYICPNPNCYEPVEGVRAIRKAIERGDKELPCLFCGRQIPLLDLIEEKFASDEFQRLVREMEEKARISIDNESRELILIGHAYTITAEAGQIFRPTSNTDWGIDGEIEFKNNKGQASGKRVYLQLKSGDSYLEERKDGKEIFRIKKERHAEYWQAHEYPVMLVIRTSNGTIRWMNVTEYLKKQNKTTKQIIFEGEPFTVQALWRMRDHLLL